MRAVIDRFEGDIAVVLMGEEEIRFDLSRQYLPAEAREGSILRVCWEVDQEETEAVLNRMRSRIEKLKRRGAQHR